MTHSIAGGNVLRSAKVHKKAPHRPRGACHGQHSSFSSFCGPDQAALANARVGGHRWVDSTACSILVMRNEEREAQLLRRLIALSVKVDFGVGNFLHVQRPCRICGSHKCPPKALKTSPHLPNKEMIIGIFPTATEFGNEPNANLSAACARHNRLHSWAITIQHRPARKHLSGN